MTRSEAVNAALVKADAKALGLTQVCGVMLAIGATRPGLTPVMIVWALALVAALLALFPIMRGDYGFVAWAAGRDGIGAEVRELSRMAVFKYRCVQVSIALLILSPCAFLIGG